MSEIKIQNSSHLVVSDSTVEEYRKLIASLQKLGYTVFHDLDRIKDDERIVAIAINAVNKEVFESNVTCMAGWCSKFKKRYPLTVQTFLDNLDGILIDPVPGLYDRLLKESYINRYGKERKETR